MCVCVQAGEVSPGAFPSRVLVDTVARADASTFPGVFADRLPQRGAFLRTPDAGGWHACFCACFSLCTLVSVCVYIYVCVWVCVLFVCQRAYQSGEGIGYDSVFHAVLTWLFSLGCTVCFPSSEYVFFTTNFRSRETVMSVRVADGALTDLGASVASAFPARCVCVGV